MGTFTLVISLVIVFCLLGVLFGGQLPKQYRHRNCQGKGWRTAFPSASKQDIREFLSLFVGAFAFRETEKLKLNPEDPIYIIYLALYPSSGIPDSLELETLCFDLEKKYGLSLQDLWHEQLTLGELFATTRKVAA
jgi:propanediol dehydratase small subunit